MITDLTEKEETPAAIQTFLQLRQGQFAADCSMALADLVSSVQSTLKPGSMIITLTMKPAVAGDPRAMAVVDRIKLKKPAADTPASLLYATDEKGLVQNSPGQMALALASQPVEDDQHAEAVSNLAAIIPED